MTDRESIDYVKRVIKNSEKVIFAGQPANELRLYTTDKGLEMLKRVVELAESQGSEKIAYWVDGHCNHCGHKAPSTSMPEMGGYSIAVPDLTDHCPGCGYKMEKE